MIRTDAERTFQPIHRTRTHNGDERDALTSDHTAQSFRPGERRTVKRSANGRDRAAARVQLARYTTI